MTDAFAEASAAHSQQASDTAPAQQWIPEGAAADMDDPFATSSDIKTGGLWDPRVPFEDIQGRLVVMIPREYDETAPNPFPGQEGKTREEFRVDLVVLDGGDLSYEYNETDPADKTKKILKTREVPASDLPFVARLQSVAQGGLVKKLKGVAGLPSSGAGKVQFSTIPRLYLGVMAYAPYVAAEKKGATIDSVTATVEQWIARQRKGTKPEYTWTLDDRPHVLTPERKQIAGAWWAEYRKTL